MYQLPREFGSFNGLAVLYISVDCVRLGVLWRFSRLVNCLDGIHVYIFGSKVYQSCTRGILTNSFLAF